MFDPTDMEILRLLQKNARMQWKEIGEKVHLTGQAVAARIQKLEDLGVIEGFTVKVNPEKLGKPITAFVTVFMKTAGHQAFERFAEGCEMIVQAYRISGEGCYLLEVNVSTREDLNRLLDEILKHGNFRINLSLGKVK